MSPGLHRRHDILLVREEWGATEDIPRMRLRSPVQPSASSRLSLLSDFNLPSPVPMKTLAEDSTTRQEMISEASGDDNEGEWLIDESLARERLCCCLHGRMGMRRHVRQGSEYPNCKLASLSSSSNEGQNASFRCGAQCSVGGKASNPRYCWKRPRS